MNKSPKDTGKNRKKAEHAKKIAANESKAALAKSKEA
jgi:hypothetical protein